MCEQLTLHFVGKWLGPIHIVNTMNRFDMSAVPRRVATLTALDAEGHSAEGSKSRNQYAKSARASLDKGWWFLARIDLGCQPINSLLLLARFKIFDFRHRKRFADGGHPLFPGRFADHSDLFDVAAMFGGKLNVLPHRAMSQPWKSCMMNRILILPDCAISFSTPGSRIR